MIVIGAAEIPAPLQELGTTLGGTVSLAIRGRTTEWRVVGVLRRVSMGRSDLYVSDAGFAQATGQVGLTQGLRIVTTEHTAGARQAVLRTLENELAAEGVSIPDVGEHHRLAGNAHGQHHHGVGAGPLAGVFQHGGSMHDSRGRSPARSTVHSADSSAMVWSAIRLRAE